MLWKYRLSRPTGESGIVQRTEARSHLRNDVPMKRSKAYDTLKDPGSSDAGDSRRKKGGTQKFPAIRSQL